MSSDKPNQPAQNVIEALKALPTEQRYVTLVAVLQMLDSDDPVSDGQRALEIAVKNGWLTIAGEDAVGQAVYDITPAGDAFVSDTILGERKGDANE